MIENTVFVVCQSSAKVFIEFANLVDEWLNCEILQDDRSSCKIYHDFRRKLCKTIYSLQDLARKFTR